MKKALKILGVVIITLIVLFICNIIMTNKRYEDLEKSYPKTILNPINEIKATVSGINREMPIKVNENTIAVNVEYLEEENRFVLNYQLTNIKKGDLSKEEVDNTVQSLKRIKLQHTVSNPDNKTFIKQKVTFEYVYKDINDNVVYSFQIEPNEYLSK